MDERLTADGRLAQVTFDRLVQTIAEELGVQVQIRRLENPDGVEATARLIADMIARRFEVKDRPRPEVSP